MKQFVNENCSTVLIANKKVDNFGEIIVPLSIYERMKQFENENCSTVLIKKWTILVIL